MTGGAGFIGTALTRRLVNDNEIFIYDNLHRDAISNSGLLQHRNVKFISGDVLDFERLKESMAGSQIVVHLAAIAGVDEVMKGAVKTLKVNIIGTYNVLEAARTLPKLERLIDFSTSEVFGSHAYKVDELHETSQGAVGEARWTYAVSKLVGEHFSHAYCYEFGLPTVSVRPFNIYGPGQVGGGAIKVFVLKAVKNENLIVHGDGSQIRAWCYIDDLIDGVLLTLTKPEAVGNSFNIGNPRSTITVYNLALEVIRLSGASSKIEFKPINYTDIEIRVPNIDKARTFLGYEPKIELQEGILRTLEWYKENSL
jgi:nucleoside-diphosphate-sugar epimerase